MINEKEIEGLRHTEYSSDPVVMEMLDTLELLWKVVNAAEKMRAAWIHHGCAKELLEPLETLRENK